MSLGTATDIDNVSSGTPYQMEMSQIFASETVQAVYDILAELPGVARQKKQPLHEILKIII